MWAIISDIHANLEALEAVAKDIEKHNVEKVICLGDIVGFGPNPCECVDWVMRCDVTLMGDHDESVFGNLELLNLSATQSVLWTRSKLRNADDPLARARLDFLGSRPLTHTDGDKLIVHGSPRNPLNEYIFPEDIHNSKKMEKIFHELDRYCFHGHTHVPGVIAEDLRFLSPMELGNTYRLDGRKTLIDVGSVGQPRDGDPRACYVLLDDDIVIFRRIDYDMTATVIKIRDNPDLDDFLGTRLISGR